MPGYGDPNDPTFTQAAAQGQPWQWNPEKKTWESSDPALNWLMNDLPHAFGFDVNKVPLGSETPGYSINTGQSDADRAGMADFISQLDQQAATGGGAWESALAANTDQSNAVAQSLSQSLPGAERMTQLRAGGNAVAANNQREAGQAELLRAQTAQQATGSLGDVLAGQQQLDASQAQAGADVDFLERQGNVGRQMRNDRTATDLFGGFVQAAGAMAGMSDGGRVPGTPEIFGDDERNDTVPAKLSPGEIVIPISISARPDAPEAAAAFVAAVKGRHHQGTNFDDGGQVPVFGPEEIDQHPTVSLSTTGPASAFDPRAYNETRDLAVQNQGRQLDMAQGTGPTVAPQAFRNAQDANIGQALLARAPVDTIVGKTAAATQGAAGNAAGIVAGEQQRGADAFARAVLQQRQQDLAIAVAQQQAEFRNEQLRLGVDLEQQAQLKNLMGASAQGAMGLSDLFNDDTYGMEPHGDHGSSSGSHGGYDPGLSSGHFADGGEVKRLRPLPPKGERAHREKERTPEEDWKQFPDPLLARYSRKQGTQLEDEPQRFAEGGDVQPFDENGNIVENPSLLEQLARAAGQGIAPIFGQRVDAAVPTFRTASPAELGNRPQLPMEPHLARETAPTGASTPAGPPLRPVAPTQSASPARAAVQRQPEADPYAQQREGLRIGAEAEAAKGRDTAAALGELQKGLQENAIEAKEVQTRARQQAEADFGAVQQARDELRSVSTTVDPGRWWASRSTPGRIASVIGLVLGAIGNDNGVNRAVGLINQFIDRDLDAQKAQSQLQMRQGEQALGAATQLYGLHRQMTQDDIAANLAAKGTALDLAKSQVDIAAAKSMEPMAKSRLLELSGALDVAKKQSDDAAKQRGFDNSIKRMNAETDRMRAVNEGAKAGAAAGKTLPAEQVAALAELPVAMRQLDSLGKKFETTGSGDAASMVLGKLPDAVGSALSSDVGDYRAQALQTMQAVGKIMEGGKLAAGDEDKYRRMLPQVGDRPELARQKIQDAKAFLDDLVRTRKQTFAQAGYSVPGGETDQNAEAVAWLKANPNHPDAAAVKKKLGL